MAKGNERVLKGSGRNALIGTVMLLALALLFHFYRGAEYASAQLERERSMSELLLADLLLAAEGAEGCYLQKLSTYEDGTSAARQAELRRHLLFDHLRVAMASGEIVHSDAELEQAIESERFVLRPGGAEEPYYYYNVAQRYRAFTPAAAEGLDLVARRFQERLEKHGCFSGVKIAISSAFRPVDYQQELRGRNVNASFESTHSYGVSFDIFYEDFFVALPEVWLDRPELSDEEVERYREKFAPLRRRLGFLLGDAYFRQFHSTLETTLLEMQREGELYAILERNQKCYHVTPLSR